jgi:hypothetical protein
MQINIENLFKKIGYEIKDMEINKGYNIKNKNIQLLAYDHKLKQNTYKQVEYIIYKGLHEVWEMRTLDNYILLRGKEDHKVFNPINNEYIMLKNIKKGFSLLKSGEIIEFYVTNTKKIEPIVDIQIDGQNYFTNGLLSHNTVAHLFLGEQINDWKKVKNFIKKVIINSELPYITISPTFSMCQRHGYIPGDANGVCPKCREEQLEQYAKKKLKLLMQLAEIEKNTNVNSNAIGESI